MHRYCYEPGGSFPSRQGPFKEGETVFPGCDLSPCGKKQCRDRDERKDGNVYFRIRPLYCEFFHPPDQGDEQACQRDVGVAIGQRMGADFEPGL